jgi:ubiquinone/menaquinone biosynthesis C-methylase UbiE
LIKGEDDMDTKYGYIRELVESGYSPDNIDGFHRIVMSYLAEKLTLDKDSFVVDVGMGSGHCILPLAEAGYSNLVGIDADSCNFKIFESKGIRCVKIDVEKEAIPLADASADAVIAFHLIEHLADPQFFLSEALRVLKEGGYFVLVTPDWRRQYKIFWRDHTHRHPYDKMSVSRMLRCFEFEIVSVSNFGVVRGLGGTGIWKLFRSFMFTGIDIIAIARKPENK